MALPVIARFLLFAGLPVIAHQLRKSAGRRRLADPASRSALYLDRAAAGINAANRLRSLGGPRKWAVRAAQAATISYVSSRWAGRWARADARAAAEIAAREGSTPPPSTT